MGCDDTRCKTITLSSDFNPRIPYGMRRSSSLIITARREFQSTHPVWDATLLPVPTVQELEFQSTHPVWDATCSYFIWGVPCAFQSTHPVWDATKIREALAEGGSISIHASRMGCDGGGHGRNAHSTISIHASRMGCDPKPTNSQPKTSYFNPRIPYGMRPSRLSRFTPTIRFQSTHPVWDATQIFERLGQAQYISIHASRMGCDVTTSWTTIPHFHFNPRIPYGMRRWWWRASMRCSVFQSTHPVWDATGRFRQTYRYRVISIHASRMGCDRSCRVA